MKVTGPGPRIQQVIFGKGPAGYAVMAGWLPTIVLGVCGMAIVALVWKRTLPLMHALALLAAGSWCAEFLVRVKTVSWIDALKEGGRLGDLYVCPWRAPEITSMMTERVFYWRRARTAAVCVAIVFAAGCAPGLAILLLLGFAQLATVHSSSRVARVEVPEGLIDLFLLRGWRSNLRVASWLFGPILLWTAIGWILAIVVRPLLAPAGHLVLILESGRHMVLTFLASWLYCGLLVIPFFGGLLIMYLFLRQRSERRLKEVLQAYGPEAGDLLRAAMMGGSG